MKLSQKRNLTLLWLAQAISQAGDSIYQLALLWLVLDISQSTIMTGMIAMCAYLPALIFGLYAGVFSDRLNRFKLMITANIAQAILVVLIPLIIWMGCENIWIICSLAFCRSCFNTFFQPSLQAFIPMIFKPEQITKINSILVTSGQIAWLIGPFFAGAVLSVSSITNLFFVDSMSFVASSCLLFFIIKPKTPHQKIINDHWSDLKAGLSYLFSQHPIYWMMIITFINNIFIMGPAVVGLPILVKSVLNGSAADFAFVEGCLALGALSGSLLITKLKNIFSSGIIWSIGLILDGITFALFFFTDNIPITMIMIFFHGIGIPLIMVSRTSIIQLHTPNKYHGRLFSVVHLGVVGTTAISSALTGVFSSFIPIKFLFLFIGICGAISGVVSLTIPSIKTLR